MPSVSKKQQKFMGIVRSIQKGEQPASKFSKDAQKAAKKMKKSSVKKYAKTKHDTLPIKKESYTSNMMKAVRKGPKVGPWNIIVSKNNKIKKQVSVKNLKEIPAYMDDIKKAYPNHKIGIEAKSGKIVYREAIDFKKAHKKFKDTGELPPHLKKLVKDLDKVKVKHKVKDIVVPGLEWMSKIKESLEEAERDYKDEYKKFQSSTKAKKYRAELNKYNRKKGTYGNGDGKDASHKGGKIVGFESQSKNRGRAEKSRLKKEDIRQEIEEYVDGILDAMGEEFMVNEEKECMCEACQKGYMTHPTRKTKVMFGKRYRNCIKAEGNVNEESKAIKQISNLAKKNKYGTVDGTRMNAKTANLIMKIYNHPKMKSYKKKLDTYKSHELVDMTINMSKILKIKESIKEYSGFSGMSTYQRDLLAKQKGSPIKKSSPKVKKAQDAWSKKYLVKNGGINVKKLKKDGHPPFPTDKNYDKLIKKFPFLKEGSCGYGIDGNLGEEPAGPHLLKKKKKKKDEVSLGGRMSKKISKHRGTRNKAEVGKILKYLMKKGDTKKDALDKIEQNYDYVSKKYRTAPISKKAEILTSLQESISEKIKLKGKSGMGTISHVGMPKASKGVEKLFKIADTGFGKVGGQTVDSMSANLFKQIYNKANDDIKKKLNTKNEKQLIRILAGMWDKFGKNVKIGSSL